MSYILEALKKSQQQRALGQVPTLDQDVMFDDDRVPARDGQRGWLAVGLAGLALMIALYAALRTPAQSLAPVPEPAPEVAVPSVATDPLAVLPPAAPAIPLPEEPMVDAGRAVDASAILPDRSPADVGPEPVSTPAPSMAPSPVNSRVTSAAAPDQDDVLLDPQLELQLQRQLEADQALLEEPAPAPRRPPQRAAVPADLVDDIEAFKQQIRREQGIPPPPSRRQSVDITGDPTSLRLTPMQQAQLPAYFMTVHVYNSDPSKRFVNINGLRYLEGEETRDGIRIERIIPEGAVLSYLGNPFFVRR
ncbi:MAG: hypothetical protein EOM91_05785 [Sphingobacteriia bacterium]|nr:hypothetical protein [Sphingobacteriia bacterium]NCC40299.1 hypothetical protein [Gammaproteobacteria bacterium]